MESAYFKHVSVHFCRLGVSPPINFGRIAAGKCGCGEGPLLDDMANLRQVPMPVAHIDFGGAKYIVSLAWSRSFYLPAQQELENHR